MFGKEPPDLSKQFVILDEREGFEPIAGAPQDRDAALRSFGRCLQLAPKGYFGPYTGRRLRLVCMAELSAAKRDEAAAVAAERKAELLSAVNG